MSELYTINLNILNYYIPGCGLSVIVLLVSEDKFSTFNMETAKQLYIGKLKFLKIILCVTSPRVGCTTAFVAIKF